MNKYIVDYNRIKELCEMFENEYEYYTLYFGDKAKGPICTCLRDILREDKMVVGSDAIPKLWFHNKFEYQTDQEKLCFEIGERVE